MRSALFVYCLTHKKINRPLRFDMYLCFFASIHMEITEIKVERKFLFFLLK